MSLQKTQIILETTQLTSIPKAAEILGVHFVTVYRWVKDGKLNVFRIGNQTYLNIDEVKEMAKKRLEGTKAVLALKTAQIRFLSEGS